MKLINIIAFPATIFLAVLLMLSGLVPTVSPDTNSWLPLLGLAFPILFLLMVLALIYWLIQLKWRSLFALSCLLLNLGQASLYIQWNDLKTKDAKTDSQGNDANSKDGEGPIDKEMLDLNAKNLKIITYNTQLFGLYQNESSVDIVNTEYMPAMDSFLQVLKKENADVVCLQEVYAKAGGLKALARFLKAEGGYDYSQTYTLSERRPYGMIVLSKYQIKRWQPISLGAQTGNMAMWVDVEIPSEYKFLRNARIRIYNLHLQSFRFAKKDFEVMQKQTQQQQIDIEGSKGIITRLRMGYQRRAQQVKIIKENLLVCDFPKVICGDFNDIPVSYSYRQLSSGMRDAFVEAGSGLETTYKGSMPSFRIDYILFDNPMRALQYQSIEEVPSDHKLVIAELQVVQLFRR
ncbi:MAG: endonuclease/exonuclease/phosphatase family protein [Bacteroidetes bacterium]|nr:endonuclease/exonuclease/phosphatase family protein [Bacteroidota bacterium]MDA1223928.1 endonuclease/exonuclease/phosphatase family protein [Bacteroidota bacterium]